MRYTSLITVASEAVRKLKVPQNVTVHGKLAAYLALNYDDKSSDYKAWQDVWPKMEEFECVMPFHWDKSLQNLLPHAAKRMCTIS